MLSESFCSQWTPFSWYIGNSREPLQRGSLFVFSYLKTDHWISMISVVFRAVSISSSIFSESFCSERRITLRFGFVTGCFATKMVQQSSNGWIEVSKVSIFLEIRTISSLSKPITGRYTGSVQTSFVEARLCKVWLATCPMLSPVISPRQRSF